MLRASVFLLTYMKDKRPLYIAGIITLFSATIFFNTLMHGYAYAPQDVALIPAAPPVVEDTVEITSEPVAEQSQAAAVAQVKPQKTTVVLASTKKIVSLPTRPVEPNYPATLVIPDLSIDAKVQQTSVTTRGTMGTPTNYTDVAWYAYGTVPGERGSAVIDGHVDNSLGLDAVFRHLPDIKVGADVYVITQKGKRLHFLVTDISIYDYVTAPVNKIFTQGDKAYLRLITCGGEWVASEKTYNKRVVVTAELQG